MSEKNQSQNTENLGELLKIRREKLAALQEAGKNPFEITKYDVTHHSSDVKENFEELEASRFLWQAELCQSVLWVRLLSAIFRT